MDAGLVDRMSQTKRGKSIISYRTYCNLVENSPRIILPWERAGMFPKIVHVLLFLFRKVGIAREDSGERKCVWSPNVQPSPRRTRKEQSQNLPRGNKPEIASGTDSLGVNQTSKVS